MNVLTCHDQDECRAVLDKLQIHEVFRPTPGTLVADGIIQLDPGCWLIGTNDRGQFTLHFLEGTKAEAWAFFDSLNGGCGHINPRLSVVGPSAPVPANN